MTANRNRTSDDISALKILFISHNASRTGAPILLLSFLRWLKCHSVFEFDILLRDAGDLAPDFEEIAPVYLFNPPIPPLPVIPPQTMIRRILRVLFRRKRPQIFSQNEWTLICHEKHRLSLWEQISDKGYSLIYSNTMTNGEVLEYLSPLGAPVISHVHELEDIIQIFSRYWPHTKAHTDNFIAASQAVKDNLVKRHEIPSSKVTVAHEFVADSESSVSSVSRTELGLPQASFIVCASGTAEWRKGQDLFILMADNLIRSRGVGQFHFVWVGDWATDTDRRRGQDLVEKLEIQDSVTFTGHVANPREYFAAADVFAMVSREDPFPLVCLEAALQGRPILCFDKAGGMPEFVQKDAGFVVPFCDVHEMARCVEQLSDNPKLCSNLGKRAREKVEEKYLLDAGSQRLFDVISRALSQSQITLT